MLLRNYMHRRLSMDAATSWWFDMPERYHFNKPFLVAVSKAKRRIEQAGMDVLPDQIVATMALDNWRFLLVRRHEATIWRALVSPKNGGMEHFRSRNRRSFESDVATLLHLRNRASHQEPIIHKGTPTQEEGERVASFVRAILRTAQRIDPAAAAWIAKHSRVPSVLSERPGRSRTATVR